MQVVTFTLEKRMFLNVQHDVEIAGGAAMCAGLAQPGEADACSILDSGGNLCVHCPLAQHAAFAFALGTRIGDDAACALARGTGASHAEESLLVANLAAPATGSAGDGSLAGSRTRAAAVLAGLVAANRNVGLHTKSGFFEFERDIFTQVGTALGSGAPAGAAPEKVSETEKVPEDLADVLEHRGVEPAGPSTAHRGMSEAIVCGSLVGVCEDGVGLAAFLEFFFRVGVIRIAVGMKLQRQLAVGALDLWFTGFAGNSEHFVIVAFYVTGQNGSKSFRISCVSALWVTGNLDHRGAQQAALHLVAAL